MSSNDLYYLLIYYFNLGFYNSRKQVNSLSKKNALIKGTIILTLTGFASRIIGFFYRIFLSNTIGAEGMGIYQLIFPVYTMCFSLTAASIQTAISRFVATSISLHNKKSAKDIFFVGLFLSLSLSALVSLILYNNAAWIATTIILESRCTPLLEILAFTIPLGSIHSCISGYYYGIKKASIPAISQLFEQCARVLAVYLIYLIFIDKGYEVTPGIAVAGIVIGELFSALFSTTAILIHFSNLQVISKGMRNTSAHLRNIILLSLPLTANRVFINVLQSAEAILIPNNLKLYGLNTSGALSVYGILTGMALPLILFPSTLTNSVSVMLMPAIAEEQAVENMSAIKKSIYTTIKYCLLLGILFTGLFLVFGYDLGVILFNSQSAGNFIMTLAWICPFLFLTSTLGSILHGLGKTFPTFIINMVGLGIRIFFVLFFIPIFGITGYLWGILVSQLIIALLCLFILNHYVKLIFPVTDWILKPILSILIATGISLYFNYCMNQISFPHKIIPLFLSILILCGGYLFILLLNGSIHLKALKS